MEKVRVAKGMLLNELRANREKHEGEYTEAAAGWHAKAIEAFEQAIADFKAGNYETIHPLSTLPKPQHHLKDYDLAIRMLEMSVDDNIQIEQFEFNQYVMDEWTWKQGFALTNSGYLA